MEKQFGVYPGSFKGKESYLEKCTQLELFLMIYEKNFFIQKFLTNQSEDNWETCAEEIYGYVFALKLTEKFGVIMPEIIDLSILTNPGESIQFWYIWCAKYINNNISRKQLSIIKKNISLGKSISKYKIPTIDFLLASFTGNENFQEVTESIIEGTKEKVKIIYRDFNYNS